jgi:DNA gyrase subunit A
MPGKKTTATPVEEQIITTEYSELMQKSYIDYAMSVIIARALPDVRDGLKPVQRRTLYDMSELGIHYNGAYRKSARIVGDTMGKYHPHGDSSIYDSLVVMAQDFKKTMPLVDGHGNFGTIEGDSAAAMRYTEARLQKITEESMLADLDKDVVDFVPNFDETEKEPSVLPCMIPNFLINGSEGIAVGMATSTPTHNAAEAIDAEIAYLDDPDISLRDLMKLLPGPDFPTGGVIINKNDLYDIYETGVGKIRIRGRMTTEKGRNGHINLIVTEIPYPMIGAGIAKFLQDVASLSENKATNDIVDISNQSSKEGIRIVIELRKDTDVENFKALLLKKTRLLDTFGVNMLAIRDGRPETLGLKDILKANVEFAFEVTRRKYETLLEKEKEKREIQEGLIKAVNVIDLVIEILRGSKSRDQAKKCLVAGETKGIHFKSKSSEVMATQLQFTEPQADAILNMRLYKLIGLELDALVAQHEETVANIYKYDDILENRSSMSSVIRRQLLDIRKEYAQPRRTEIINEEVQEFQKKAEEEMDVVFVMDRFGYAKTITTETFEKNADAVTEEYRYHFTCKNTGKVCIFTNTGNMYTVKVSDLPAGKLRDKGKPIDNVSDYDEAKESIVFITSQSSLNLYRILFVTKTSMIKMVSGGEFDVTRRTISATSLADGDELVYAGAVTGQQTVVLQSKDGYFLKFNLDEVAEQKKNAKGVRGMKLGRNDHVETAYLLNPTGPNVILYHEKELDLSRLKQTSRGGKGSKH